MCLFVANHYGVEGGNPPSHLEMWHPTPSWAEGPPSAGGKEIGLLCGVIMYIYTLFYIRTSFIRRSGSISRKFKKILRRSRGWILENFEKIEAEMCVYYINLRRSGSIFWKIKKI